MKMCARARAYVFMYVYMYVFMYVYMYTCILCIRLRKIFLKIMNDAFSFKFSILYEQSIPPNTT